MNVVPQISMKDALRAEAAIEPDAPATAAVTKETQIIAIYGKGGIGKSFTLANLSYMMAQQGKKVLLIGCDPKSDTTSLLFGGRACPTIIETSSKKKLAGEEVKIGDVCFKRDGVFAMELGGPEVGRGCGGRGIIHGFELLEKLGFHEWGFDYIKVDGCGLRDFGPNSPKVKSGQARALTPIMDLGAISRTDVSAVQDLFRRVGAAIEHSNPDGDFVYSLCIWGAANVRAWAKDVGNVSRTSDDISPAWGRLLVNYDSAVHRALYAHPGSWNDPDMLFIGAGDFDAEHLTEARSHFALWAMMNAPLLIGADLRKTPDVLMDILGNADIIALDQDVAGNQATVAYDSSDLQILVKTLANGEKAVAVFNRGSGAYDVNLQATQLKFRDDAPVQLTDLWTKKQTTFTKETRLHLAPRETLIFRARGVRALPDGFYLSEQPGRVNPAVDGVTRPIADPTIFRTAAGWAGTRGAGDRPQYAGWGGARADSAPYGQTLQVARQVYPSGIGILANSRLEVRNDDYARFTAKVGVDDSATDKTREVTFTVYGDGKRLVESHPMKWGMPAETLEVNVDGVKLIELVARSAATQNEALPVTWGEAALTGH